MAIDDFNKNNLKTNDELKLKQKHLEDVISIVGEHLQMTGYQTMCGSLAMAYQEFLESINKQ